MCTKNNNENYLSTTTKEKNNNNKTKTLHAPKVNLVILKESMKKKLSSFVKIVVLLTVWKK